MRFLACFGMVMLMLYVVEGQKNDKEVDESSADLKTDEPVLTTNDGLSPESPPQEATDVEDNTPKPLEEPPLEEEHTGENAPIEEAPAAAQPVPDETGHVIDEVEGVCYDNNHVLDHVQGEKIPITPNSNVEETSPKQDSEGKPSTLEEKEEKIEKLHEEEEKLKNEEKEVKEKDDKLKEMEKEAKKEEEMIKKEEIHGKKEEAKIRQEEKEVKKEEKKTEKELEQKKKELEEKEAKKAKKEGESSSSSEEDGFAPSQMHGFLDFFWRVWGYVSPSEKKAGKSGEKSSKEKAATTTDSKKKKDLSYSRHFSKYSNESIESDSSSSSSSESSEMREREKELLRERKHLREHRYSEEGQKPHWYNHLSVVKTLALVTAGPALVIAIVILLIRYRPRRNEEPRIVA